MEPAAGAAASGLIVHGAHPLNAEPPVERLGRSALTPVADFYVRCHGDIPAIDARAWRLAVRGAVARPLDLALADLVARFPARTLTAAMQCAGNRRGELAAVAPVSGDPWAPGAIGNAEWTGVALADVLRAAGVREGADLQVAFDAHDRFDIAGEQGRFGVSIPLGKALAPEVLLAHAMNGAPLAPQHGFPLRAVVPGYAGVRSAKWLATITVQDAPSANHMQRHDYKLFPPDVTKETADWTQGLTIDAMPLTAAFCEPVPDARLSAGPARVRGYAIAGERRVARVDVSGDGGRTWRQADLSAPADAPWAWTLWEATLELAPGAHELCVRAWDEAGQTQPARPEEVWNFKGYLNASWHRVRVVAQ